MIRAPMGDRAYWDKQMIISENGIIKGSEGLKTPAKNPTLEAQFVWILAQYYPRWIIARYSHGDPIRDLGQHFPGLLDAWELSNRLSDEICVKYKLLHRNRSWTFDLSDLPHYNWCFWLVGLALTLEIPDEQWKRLLALIGAEGEDVLLDRVIASRAPGRKIGTTLLHKKPYARLLKAVDAPQAKQAQLLKDFVDRWYAELARRGDQRPLWYFYCDPEKYPLSMFLYFGCWCIEAVAAVKAFGLDDSLCLGHEHYPGDLLRPDGPSTHPARLESKTGFFGKLFGKK